MVRPEYGKTAAKRRTRKARITDLRMKQSPQQQKEGFSVFNNSKSVEHKTYTYVQMLKITRLVPALSEHVVLRRLIYFLLALVIWLAVVITTYFVYSAELAATQQSRGLTQTPKVAQFINITARLGEITLLGGTVQILLDFHPAFASDSNSAGNVEATFPLLFETVPGSGEVRLTTGITIVAGDNKFDFAVGERLGPVALTVGFSNGSLRAYPFDVYTGCWSYCIVPKGENFEYHSPSCAVLIDCFGTRIFTRVFQSRRLSVCSSTINTYGNHCIACNPTFWNYEGFQSFYYCSFLGPFGYNGIFSASSCPEWKSCRDSNDC
jgi:hypothetical protein